MSSYFELGFHHIVGWQGSDHVLFIIVLCAAYAPQAWRQVLALLTGFTLGHSLTLALTALQLVSFSPRIIETLIPLTILATSLSNIALPPPRGVRRPFLLASAFGLIHGCGFAGYFTMMLGDETSILAPLLLFNLGLEAGQLVVAAAFYTMFFLLEKWRPIPLSTWTLAVSCLGAGLAVTML